ncbi:hypothetical protein [Nocardia cyriacigeorgica]|nr:hypothetical protein [Nocardia cyriacigeorgica]BDT87390.1 hypothetical protein FMUAM8_31540 [Nocardia cyriacigeorgica]
MTIPEDERWLSELVAILNRQVVVYTDVVPIPHAAMELLAWLQDPRDFRPIQHRDWQSAIRDYQESFRLTGPRLERLLQNEHRTLESHLNSLFTEINGRHELDENARVAAAAAANTLLAATVSDPALIAAWKDMVRETQSTARHTDCLESRRQCWSAIIELRCQDTDEIVRRCAEILNGSGSVPEHLLNLLTPDQMRDLAVDESGPLRSFQKLALCEAVLTAPTPTGDCVVWLRFDNAHIKQMEIAHGNINLYAAQLLGPLVGHVDSSPALKFRPPELATPIRNPRTGEEIRWDEDPGIIYVRVSLDAIPLHLAVPQARAIAATLVQVTDPLPGTWHMHHSETVYMDGKLRRGGIWPQTSATDRQARRHIDDIGHRLEDVGAMTTITDIATIDQVEVALSLRSALNSAWDTGPVELVMGAVRALEHVTAWAGGHDWMTFLSKRFRNAISHAQLVEFVNTVVDAAAANTPSDEPFAEPPEELRRLTNELHEWNGEADQLIPLAAIGHAAELRDIFANHWLHRSLAEVAGAFESGTALNAKLEAIDRRFNRHLDRLRRVRNSAIHGGPITTGVCETIASFAFHLSRYCLEQVLLANLTGVDIRDHIERFSDDQASRRKIATTQQSYERLFT